MLTAASDAGAMTMDLAQRFFEPVSELIRQGQEIGLFRPDLVAEDTPRLVLMLVGTLPSFENGDEGWQRYLTLLMDMLDGSGVHSELPEAVAVRAHNLRD
ncbi:hypothetical protein MOQ72_42980 [Saccharopolyspora sp. K220]|uniref:hypothetical protein n=1 Tax=Saccharopolyspora soli TaxID=2926618 RepID=UPI001F57823E|nr:hypothetical protein [Saccharopolyspora soli]MCI2424180.1 hypothetical protein [Saccharopolyspora soli]